MARAPKILSAARLASTRPNLHVVYISNFKCGPDSYIKPFTREAAGAPLLVLERVGKGRSALLLSDQIWLWSRGHQGGGPQAELLRRIAAEAEKRGIRLGITRDWTSRWYANSRNFPAYLYQDWQVREFLKKSNFGPLRLPPPLPERGGAPLPERRRHAVQPQRRRRDRLRPAPARRRPGPTRGARPASTRPRSAGPGSP